jgi:glyoxylase-like metal-dependent hydrolase (beta-lactamase superfamily II)
MQDKPHLANWVLEVLPVGPLQMNAVLLTAEGPDGPEAILFDPGAEAPRLLHRLVSSGCRLTHLLATHGHFDHVGAAAEIQQVHDLPLVCHAGDLPLIEQMPVIQAAYGFPATTVPRCQPDLVDGARIPFAGQEITVRHVPGHSPGQVMFVLPGLDPLHAVVGDCLFHGSVGRTDLPGGDFPTLEKSIRERIYTLPDETVVVPGHGPGTTVGYEKGTNPFVRG